MGSTDSKLHGETMKNMMSFWKSGPMRKAAVQQMAKQIDTSQIAKLNQVFAALDLDGSGELTREEIRIGFDKADLGLGTGAEGWRTCLEKSLESKGSRINYSAFLGSISGRQGRQQERSCWAAFSAFDKDGSGYIDRRELGEVLRNIHCGKSLT